MPDITSDTTPGTPGADAPTTARQFRPRPTARSRKRTVTTKRDPANLAGARVGLYVRVSKDRDGKQRSVSEQEAIGRAWIEGQGAELAGIYRDSDRSASRYATRQREDFARLVADVTADRLDVVWVWEQSRSTRKLDEFARLRDLCRDHGVLWAIQDQVYDPSGYAQAMTLGVLTLTDEVASEQTSDRVRRDMQFSAAAGRPHSFPPYGYRRIYDPHTRKLVRQEPDVGDGGPDSPAVVVVELFTRFAEGASVYGLAKDLNERGVPTFFAARGGRSSPAAGTGGQPRTTVTARWWPSTMRQILRNPAYIGRRVHQGEVLAGVDALWPPLVDEETFWTVQAVLDNPKRLVTRPSRGSHLLSWIARCDVCGDPLVSAKSGARSKARRNYICRVNAHVAIAEDALDAYVEQVLLCWLRDPEVYQAVASVSDSAAAVAARAEAVAARVELAELLAAAERGEVSWRLAGATERGLLARIADAEQRAQAAAVPAPLVGMLGPEAAALWRSRDMPTMRQIVRTVLDIRLRPVGRGKRPPIDQRVILTPLLGDPDWQPRLAERGQATDTLTVTKQEG
jgi:DNA invertase Pin-like site-specific DNA recombinase